jgi:hypothetical protein
MQITKVGSFRRILLRPEEGTPGPRIHMGPWVGEFGYEVASWLPHVRHIRKRRPGAQIVVSGDLGHHVLYEGLADEYWTLPDLDGDRLCEWREGSGDLGFAKNPGPVLRELLSRVHATEQLWPRFLAEREKLHEPIGQACADEARARAFLSQIEIDEPFALLFPRKRTGERFEGRNWAAWADLAELLRPRVVTSGRGEDTELLFGVPSTLLAEPFYELGITIALMRRAAVLVMVSSGAALLAGCMHLHDKMIVIGAPDCANVLGKKPRLYVAPSASAEEVARAVRTTFRL